MSGGMINWIMPSVMLMFSAVNHSLDLADVDVGRL